MKKFFFFAAALVATVAASAQEIYTVSQTDYATESDVKAGTAEKTAVEAGTVLFTGTAFDVKNAFATTYQRVGLNSNTFVNLKLGDKDITVADQWGIQGNDNPKDANGAQAPDAGAPVSGAVFQIDAKADGIMYVFNKITSNKKYSVYELYGSEQTNMGYALSMITCPAGKEANKSKVGVLEGVMCSDIINDSLIVYAPETDGDNYVLDASPVVFPEIPNLKSEWLAGFNDSIQALIKKNGAYCQSGLGVIMFPVEANTSYLVNAWGSKMSLAAIAFATAAEAPALDVTVTDGTTTHTLFHYTETAVENAENEVKVTKTIENNQIVIEKNGVKYNVLGAIVK